MKNLNREDFKELMAFLTVILTFLYVFLITFIPVPKEGQRFADVILGALLTLVLGKVLGEYFDVNKNKDEPPQNGKE